MTDMTTPYDERFEDDEEAKYHHIETEHDIPVMREGETHEDAIARVQAKNPRMGGPDCECPNCRYERRQREQFIYEIPPSVAPPDPRR